MNKDKISTPVFGGKGSAFGCGIVNGFEAVTQINEADDAALGSLLEGLEPGFGEAGAGRGTLVAGAGGAVEAGVEGEGPLELFVTVVGGGEAAGAVAVAIAEGAGVAGVEAEQDVLGGTEGDVGAEIVVAEPGGSVGVLGLAVGGDEVAAVGVGTEVAVGGEEEEDLVVGAVRLLVDLGDLVEDLLFGGVGDELYLEAVVLAEFAGDGL